MDGTPDSGSYSTTRYFRNCRIRNSIRPPVDRSHHSDATATLSQTSTTAKTFTTRSLSMDRTVPTTVSGLTNNIMSTSRRQLKSYRMMMMTTIRIAFAMIVCCIVAYRSLIVVQGFSVQQSTVAMVLPKAARTKAAAAPFVASTTIQRRQQYDMQQSIRLWMSEPSDTTNDYFGQNENDDDDDDVVIVESEEYQPTAGEAMVSSILDLLPNTFIHGSNNKANGGKVWGRKTFLSSLFPSNSDHNNNNNENDNDNQMGLTSERRAAINEALYQLERINPAGDNPAVSPLINGIWELRYVGGYEEGPSSSLSSSSSSTVWTTLPSPTRQLALFLYSAGYSPGLFALQIIQDLPPPIRDLIRIRGAVEITISRQQPRIQAVVPITLLGSVISSSILLQARLDVESGMRLRETYESVKILDRPVVALPTTLQYYRDLYVTYVDDDLLVVRDATGVPEVLVRKEKTFRQNWGTEPGEIDDMVAPGEE